MARKRDADRAPVNINSYWSRSVRNAKRTLLRDALAFSEGNRTRAAEVLGISPGYFFVQCRDLGGIVDGEPVNEPYVPIYSRAGDKNEKSADSSSSGDGDAADPDRSTDDEDGETDRDDSPEDELGDEDDRSGIGSLQEHDS